MIASKDSSHISARSPAGFGWLLVGAGGTLGRAVRALLETAGAETVAFMREKNAKQRAEMERTGETWPLGPEDPKDFTVLNVRRAPKRRSA